MKNLDVSDIGKILDLADMCRDEFVPCFIGTPGIGKTKSIFKWCEENNRKCVVELLSQCMPTEVSGIGMPDTDTKSLSIFDYDKFADLEDGDVLFFDELFEAPAATLSACLTLIQDRTMRSGRKLPDILIVAATNPPNIINQIKFNVRQRFMFFNITNTHSNWILYINEKYGLNLSINFANNFLQYVDDDEYNTLTCRTMDKLFNIVSKIMYSDKYTDKEKEIKDLCESLFQNDVLRNKLFESIYQAFEIKMDYIEGDNYPNELSRLMMNAIKEYLDDEDLDLIYKKMHALKHDSLKESEFNNWLLTYVTGRINDDTNENASLIMNEVSKIEIPDEVMSVFEIENDVDINTYEDANMIKTIIDLHE